VCSLFHLFLSTSINKSKTSNINNDRYCTADLALNASDIMRDNIILEMKAVESRFDEILAKWSQDRGEAYRKSVDRIFEENPQPALKGEIGPSRSKSQRLQQAESPGGLRNSPQSGIGGVHET
jgi:hypothetical protein